MHNLTRNIANKLLEIEVLLLACSAGGFKVLFDILKALPGNLPFAVLVVIHRNAKYETNIEERMTSKCHIALKAAEDKEPIRPSTAYFAPPGYHLLVEPDHRISLDISEPVNFCRPSIDVTMQSAADAYGKGLVGILLSGANQDGALGMKSIQQAGGVCIVQDPAYAEIKTMPEAAIAMGAADLILNDEELVLICQKLGNHMLTRN